MFSARKQTKNPSSGCTECSSSEKQVNGSLDFGASDIINEPSS